VAHVCVKQRFPNDFDASREYVIVVYSGMDLGDLRYFVGVADHLSFSRAAARLQVSQSALSRRIGALERELEVHLFDRIGRRIALTGAGEELLARSRALLQNADLLRTRAHDLSTGSRGLLRLGATPQTLESLVSLLLSRYRRVCPDVEIEIIEDGAGGLLEHIERGNVHVAIGALPGLTALQGRKLFPLGVLAAVPPDHRLRLRRSIDVRELANERLLLLRRTFMTRQLFDGACQLADVTTRVMLESSSPQCLLALVERGHGVAIIPSTVRLLRRRQKILTLQQGGRPLGLWISVIWDPRRYMTQAARIFIEEAYRFTRRQYPGKGLHLARPVWGLTAGGAASASPLARRRNRDLESSLQETTAPPPRVRSAPSQGP
jgi:DNA-binding transcriptional LysR family regulator